jgi:DNA-binding CsgD family transcriptional regulator
MSAPTAAIMRLGPITEAGVESLVLTAFPDADHPFIAACVRVTQGNPLLLIELLAQLRADRRPPDAATAERLTDLAPDAIVHSVIARVGAMRAESQALATAASVLHDGCSLQHAARLAGLDLEAAAAAADDLAAGHILCPGEPLSFVHPMIRSAVGASMSSLARGQAHLRASAMLRDGDSTPEVVATHLLCARPVGDPEAVRILRSVALTALATGAPESAARLLDRALAEPPRPGLRGEILAELAQAEALAGLPQATERLTEAISLAESQARRAELALAQGRALYGRASYRRAAEVLAWANRALEIDDAALAAGLDAAYVAAASLVPELAHHAPARREQLLRQLTDPPTPSQRSAVAHVAVLDSMLGEPRSAVRRLTEVAWGDGALSTDETVDGVSWPLLASALLFTDDLERGLEICDAQLPDSREPSSRLARATVSLCRAWPLYEQGRIAKAAACAEAALDARPDDATSHLRTAYGVLACCNLQRGDVDQAEKALATIEDPEIQDSIRYPFLLDVRARLRIAQHRPEEALEDAILAGQLLESEFAVDNPGAVAYRSTAALAHLALGQTGPARELAQTEMERAQRIGVTRVVIRDLRVLGLAEGGDAGIELLQDAVSVGRRYPPRLEYIHALVDLGAALRRANQRAAAREPLRKGLELSQRGGATALARHAQTELTASGARSRRTDLSGVPALTPSERRVADRAAKGLTTRQMAKSLYVTPKTIEYHLRHIYQKLDIGSRDELATAMRSQSD